MVTHWRDILESFFNCDLGGTSTYHPCCLATKLDAKGHLPKFHVFAHGRSSWARKGEAPGCHHNEFLSKGSACSVSWDSGSLAHLSLAQCSQQILHLDLSSACNGANSQVCGPLLWIETWERQGCRAWLHGHNLPDLAVGLGNRANRLWNMPRCVTLLPSGFSSSMAAASVRIYLFPSSVDSNAAQILFNYLKNCRLIVISSANQLASGNEDVSSNSLCSSALSFWKTANQTAK